MEILKLNDQYPKQRDSRGQTNSKHDSPTPNKISCDICGKSLISKHILNHHLQVVHFEEWQFECKLCSLKFKSNSNFKITSVPNLWKSTDFWFRAQKTHKSCSQRIKKIQMWSLSKRFSRLRRLQETYQVQTRNGKMPI